MKEMYEQAAKRRGSVFFCLFVFQAKMFENSKLHQNKFNGHLGGQPPKAASPDHWADGRLMGTSPGEPPARHQQRVFLLPSGTSKDHEPHWSVLIAKRTTDPRCLCFIYPQPQGNLLSSPWGSPLRPSLMCCSRLYEGLHPSTGNSSPKQKSKTLRCLSSSLPFCFITK